MIIFPHIGAVAVLFELAVAFNSQWSLLGVHLDFCALDQVLCDI